MHWLFIFFKFSLLRFRLSQQLKERQRWGEDEMHGNLYQTPTTDRIDKCFTFRILFWSKRILDFICMWFGVCESKWNINYDTRSQKMYHAFATNLIRSIQLQIAPVSRLQKSIFYVLWRCFSAINVNLDVFACHNVRSDSNEFAVQLFCLHLIKWAGWL